jgi:hypothetical protein
MLKKALAIYEKAQIAEHPEVIQILTTYASLLVALNRHSEAREINLRIKTMRANQSSAP